MAMVSSRSAGHTWHVTCKPTWLFGCLPSLRFDYVLLIIITPAATTFLSSSSSMIIPWPPPPPPLAGPPAGVDAMPPPEGRVPRPERSPPVYGGTGTAPPPRYDSSLSSCHPFPFISFPLVRARYRDNVFNRLPFSSTFGFNFLKRSKFGNFSPKLLPFLTESLKMALVSLFQCKACMFGTTHSFISFVESIMLKLSIFQTV